VLIFDGFQALDVFGPLDFFNILAASVPLRLAMISHSLKPVQTKPITRLPQTPGLLPEISQHVVPTHTLDDTIDLDVLIVPGGFGVRTLAPAYGEFIKRVYPNLKYLLTVCTGSVVVARTGLLDGKKATTNKASWTWATSEGPKVDWVAHARWTIDGKIWTSSGVSAGLDLTYAFISTVFNEELATKAANIIEYVPHKDPNDDPFQKIWNVS
jgi:transcriptional regulator GlxA family with amidase domain